MSATSGVVLARTAGGYRVHTDAGEIIATLRGKLKHQDSDRVVPGDVVVLEGSAIAEIRPRRSVLARRAAQGSSGAGPRRAQPVAANVDQVIVVTSARDPEPSPRMIDLFTGASGAGKSSLLNALEPGLKLRVGAISEKWRTGKHTTTAAELVPVAGVGYVVDTPGLREIGAWGIDPNELGACFPEFRPYLDQCRFDNCRHLTEPGCAVRAAPPGAIDPDRLVSYERIYEEVSEPSWSSGRRRGR